MEAQLNKDVMDLVCGLSIGEKKTLYRYLTSFMTMNCQEFRQQQAQQIVTIVTEITGCNPLDITRKRKVVYARMMLIYQLYLQGFRKIDIARFVGYNHASVIYAINTMEDVIAFPNLKRVEFNLWQQLQKLIKTRNDD